MNTEENQSIDDLLKFHFKRIMLALIYIAGMASIIFYPTTKSANIMAEVFLASSFIVFAFAISRSKYKLGVTAYLKVIFSSSLAIYFLSGLIFFGISISQKFFAQTHMPFPFILIASVLIGGLIVECWFEPCSKWIEQINEEYKNINNEDKNEFN